MNLLVGGKVVLTAVGRDNERLLAEAWNVAVYKGKQAQIQIIDNETGGWGHINIDQIPQSDKPVFVDLCEGGHVENTREIDAKSFKLTHISSAYWQADENNASMQRIYGISFETAKELQDYEKMMIEAKKSA